MNSTIVLGKRKRAVVSYYDGDSDIATEPEIDDIEVYNPKQKESAPNGRSKKKGKTAKTSSSKKKAPAPFRFLDLPPELRNMIYGFALTEPDGIQLVSQSKKHRKSVRPGNIRDDGEDSRLRGWRRRLYDSARTDDAIDYTCPKLVPALLRVNRQIHGEASDFLYTFPFILEDTTALHHFLAVIGRNNRLLLKNVTIKGWGGGRGGHKARNHAALTLLADCSNLETIFFDCHVGYRTEPENLARQMYRDGHIFLETYGAANGAKDAGIAVLKMKELEGNDDDGMTEWSRGWNKQYVLEPKKAKERFTKELRKQLGCKMSG